MTPLDWTLVIVLNGSIIAHALLRPPKITSTADWFLASRNLPWWIVGLSCYATAIDSSDLVADAGGVYAYGMSYFVTNWVGTVVGWFLLAHFIIRPMYRLGMYTNAEYLEARFGPAARVISVLVQVQYRLVVMGIMAATIYLTFNIVGDLKASAWWIVGLFVLLATAYAIRGGSGSIAWTDALQSVVMMSASVVLFVCVWLQVGGWSGLERRLAEHDPALPAQTLHVGREQVDREDVQGQSSDEIARRLLLGGELDSSDNAIVRRTPAWLVSISYIIVGLAYSIVNHEQTMRLFAARSLWDIRMAVVVAALLLIIATWFNLGMGVLGRGLYPDPAAIQVHKSIERKSDAIYPVLIRDYTPMGVQGLVVAGLLAAALSTYTGTSSALASLLTRDVYGRLLVTGREDGHYLTAGRVLTLAVIAASFAYVPFVLAEGMLFFYLKMVAAFVVPLLTIYLVGAFTRASRKSGAAGLVAGVAYGVCRLLAEPVAVRYGVALLPAWLADPVVAYPASMAITATAMLLVTTIYGPVPRGDLVHQEQRGWLRESQLAARAKDEHAASFAELSRSRQFLPILLGLAVITLGLTLSFWVFW
ncbi:MAG: hypothetical protein WD468_03910 [Pirellulales bacterium]